MKALKIVGVGAGIVVVALMIGYFSIRKNPVPVDPTKSSWSPEEIVRYETQLNDHLARAQQLLASSTPRAKEVATWKTYRSEKCGFEFRYPKTYFVTEYATSTAQGMSCHAGLLHDTQKMRDWVSGKLEKQGISLDGVASMGIGAKDVPAASTTEGIVAWTVRATNAGDSALPPDPYAVITFAGEPATISSWQTIDIADTISFYHGTKRYDLTAFGSYEPMREDFYKIITTLKWVK